MEYFSRSSFGQLLLRLFASYFSLPSLANFLILAKGWCLCSSGHTITAYLRLSGGAKDKHFSRFYSFFSSPFYRVTDELWRKLILFCASFIDEKDAIDIQVDDATKKKCGRHIQGSSFYRNGAGSARQEYRNLWGLNWVWITMSIPLKKWPPHYLTIPIGLRLYLKEPIAKALAKPYYSRSQLARRILDLIASTLASRRLIITADGGYTTKEFLSKLPDNVVVVGRFSISSKLYKLPGSRAKNKRGPKPKKGALIGSAKTLASKKKGWFAHPRQANTWMQSFKGIWHSKLPGVRLCVVVVRRSSATDKQKQVEAFFSTDSSMAMEEILTEYLRRWAVEINIKDANVFYGFGQDQCRNIHCIIGVNTFRALMAACRSLWFVKQLEKQPINLLNGRPWYRKKSYPTQADVSWMFLEALRREGITPTPSFFDDVG
jgi:hypothetical protein